MAGGLTAIAPPLPLPNSTGLDFSDISQLNALAEQGSQNAVWTIDPNYCYGQFAPASLSGMFTLFHVYQSLTLRFGVSMYIDTPAAGLNNAGCGIYAMAGPGLQTSALVAQLTHDGVHIDLHNQLGVDGLITWPPLNGTTITLAPGAYYAGMWQNGATPAKFLCGSTVDASFTTQNWPQYPFNPGNEPHNRVGPRSFVDTGHNAVGATATIPAGLVGQAPVVFFGLN